MLVSPCPQDSQVTMRGGAGRYKQRELDTPQPRLSSQQQPKLQGKQDKLETNTVAYEINLRCKLTVFVILDFSEIYYCKK